MPTKRNPTINEMDDLLLMIINSKNSNLVNAYFNLLSIVGSYGLISEVNQNYKIK